MPVIRYDEKLNVLVSTKGHPYLRDPFMAAFDAIEGVACTLVEQPAASLLMNPEHMALFDVLVLYDMPGLDFAVSPPRSVLPEPEFRDGFLRLVDSGKGIVALHHAIAGWPAWDEYANLLGGRFLYKPGVLRGVSCADSGYRHDVTHTISALAPAHPVLANVPTSFTLTDELYLFEVFEDEIIPLLRSSHTFEATEFYSAALAVAGKMYSNEGWVHPRGCSLVGWVKAARNSPLAYLQFGDGPETYQNPIFRRLLENAIRWVASPEARTWAKQKVYASQLGRSEAY